MKYTFKNLCFTRIVRADIFFFLLVARFLHFRGFFSCFFVFLVPNVGSSISRPVLNECWQRRSKKISYAGINWFRFMSNNGPYNPGKLNGFGRIELAPMFFFLRIFFCDTWTLEVSAQHTLKHKSPTTAVHS